MITSVDLNNIVMSNNTFTGSFMDSDFFQYFSAKNWSITGKFINIFFHYLKNSF